MSDICVVHLVRRQNGMQPFRNFLEAYLENSAGIDHELLIVYKGFFRRDGINPYEGLLKDIPHSYLVIADLGRDLRSYFIAAEKSDSKYYCFLNSFSIILYKDWLLKLYQYIKQPGVGLVGASGSWGSIGHTQISLYKEGISYPRQLARYLYKYSTKLLINWSFSEFPNYHIRTNGFMIERDVMLKVRRGMILTKYQAYILESGKFGITRQIESMGLKPIVVGKDGKGYEKHEWDNSNTFWRRAQENLLISDNQTRRYEKESLDWKKKWEFFAWGSHAKKVPGQLEIKKSLSSELNMKRDCPYCHTGSSLYFHSKDYNQRMTQETFWHYRCPKCELIFIDPIPDNLAAYYPDHYHQVPTSIEELNTVSKTEKYRIEIVQRFITCGRLLEIGPSYGNFIHLAKNAGYEAEAIEMNKYCCQFLNEVVGVNAINSNNPIEVLEHKKPYDVIALWHVVEHLPNLWLLLDTVYASLNPGGIVVIATPNPGAFQFMLMGRYWAHLDAPRHVMMIPMKLLAEKLDSLGMKVELVTTKDRGSNYLNIFGWKHFFRRRFSHGNIRKLVSKIGRLVALVLSPIERTEGKGSAYTMVFRKPG